MSVYLPNECFFEKMKSFTNFKIIKINKLYFDEVLNFISKMV